jgi:hypothetical protein
MKETVSAPLPSTDNTKDPSPPGYCQHSNSCGNSLRTCEDTSNQARAFPHTSPKYTSVEHHPSGSNCGAAAIHQQHKMVFHYQAIASTPILKVIAQKLSCALRARL